MYSLFHAIEVVHNEVIMTHPLTCRMKKCGPSMQKQRPMLGPGSCAVFHNWQAACSARLPAGCWTGQSLRWILLALAQDSLEKILKLQPCQVSSHFHCICGTCCICCPSASRTDVLAAVCHEHRFCGCTPKKTPCSGSVLQQCAATL